MGLFVRKENTGTHVPLYSVGQNRNLLIIGLGNDGGAYDLTRHNAGFHCIDFFAENNEFPAWTLKKDLKAQITAHTLGQNRVILAKPQTFMNLSGEAMQAIQNFYKIGSEDTVIIHDELDIPFGQIRIRKGGGSAGHNGLKSVIQHGGTDTYRIRIGIRNAIADKADSSDFVLGKFSQHEQDKLKPMAQEVNAILTEYIYGGQLLSETRTFIVDL